MPEDLTCDECGEPMFIMDNGVAHHYSDETPDEIDHDADENHVPYTMEGADVC